ncbi:MAG: MopE-related protein [Archangium sp.]|nr:MopE-related protein [Archangium sp.]MDP3573202.1 MopE-related protein [Archangium sp.]
MSARQVVFTLLALAALLSACGRTLFYPRSEKCVFDADCEAGLRCVNQECTTFEIPDGGLRKKRFGQPCDAGVECNSNFCVPGPAGAFCTEPCGAGDAGVCPDSYDCKRTEVRSAPDAGAVLANLCAVPQPLLCQACTGDLDCGATGADKCVTTDGGTFCGRDCTFDGCPSLYACQAFPDGSKQCVPEGRTCDCVPETVGLQKSCRGQSNEFGRCLGNQICQLDGGFTPCIAPLALQETCNGADDDCNGSIDDFTAPECTRTVGMVTCRGPQVCFASAGLVCTARTPANEACNYEDDDCDGQIDEDFRLTRGLYSTPAHCGACNNDCSKIIAHAVTTSCDLSNDSPTCRVTACAPGFFPFEDNTMCLQLPDTLCSPCQLDSDCVGPGSRCLTVDGAKVCGRDCGPGSAYPPGCPGGYTCTASPGGGSQCVPSTGTCSCTTSTINSTRVCSIVNGGSTCSGFSTCAAGAGGARWSTCDVSTFNPEICDARDNNCDLRVDEGFLNQATGRYEAAQHCGFCNNDCTKTFSPTIQHTTGVCDLAPMMPRCTMGPCLTETVGGTTFEWVNVNALPADGCECRRVQGNLTIDLPDRAPATGAGASWVDENCDGIDGVLGDAIFVSASASPGGNGTRTSPLQTITAGVAAQQAQNRRYVLVAQGLYRENVRLFDGAQVFGGYSQDFLKRDPRLYITTWVGVAPTATAIAPVHGESLGAAGAVRETVVAGFVINGWDATVMAAASANGEASIGVFLRDVGPRFVLQSNDVIAGRGGAGGRGATGTQGFGRQAGTTLNGQRGTNSNFFANGMCAAVNHRNGGVAGTNGTCTGANGTPGGNVVCPVYTFAGNQGAQQMYQSPMPTSRDGAGGFDWSFDNLSSPGCNHVTESGFPTSIQQHDGADGKQGGDGSGGVGGPGAATRARFGSIGSGRWVAATIAAAAGQAGLTAQGGGGGGAGGGVARFTPGGCQGWEIGATGGGAGAGGCGGTGGSAGGAGGASLAILITSTTASTVLPSILNNRIQRGAGGTGGDGGFGGAGGLGGAGGFGGTAARWSSSVGGKGGEGGNGGPGGGGGGGSGGPSFGVMTFNVGLGGFSPTNTFLTPTFVDTAGSGGAGGSSPGSSTSTGTPGARGASANSTALESCSSPCVGGTCDSNNVCIPN